MASRRMFSAEIANEDKFVEMPATAQALYFHLGLRADDEGFIGSCKQLIRGLGFQTGDIKILVQEGYVIAFETGVIVITDWHMHNSIRKDRAKETRYQEEKAKLQDYGGKYALISEGENHTATTCQPDGNQMSAQVRLGKVSIGEDSTIEPPVAHAPSEKSKQSRFTPPTLEEVTAYCTERNNGISPQAFIDFYAARGWALSNRTPMKDWKAAVCTWEHRGKERTQQANTASPPKMEIVLGKAASS